MSQPKVTSQSRSYGEVLTRLASAVVLAAVTIALTVGGLWSFTALVCLVGVVVNWEWGGIVRQAGVDSCFLVGSGLLIAALVAAALGQPAIGVLVLAAGAIGAWLTGAPSRWAGALGVLYAGGASLALVWFRSDAALGLSAILLVMLVVWSADTGAFIAGRLIGGPKLWARVSPNKTWAGLIGGVALGTLVASLAGPMLGGGGAAKVALIGTGLAIVSQVGDLMESAIKRAYGVKDASQLIPGHGGFMDRVDGLIAAAAAAALYALLVNPGAPAAGLLGIVM